MSLIDRVALPLPDVLALPLVNGGETLVDADVFDRFADSTLYRVGLGYVALRPDAVTVCYLHRLIMEPPDGLVVDHISGDAMDNRRANLRVCTPQQNAQNKQKARANQYGQATSSMYRGVSWDSRGGHWMASIRTDGHNQRLGSFREEADAARAYDEAARARFGSFARLNFPRPGEQSARRDAA